MKAIGYKIPKTITASESLVDIEIAKLVAEGHDILVDVKAVSANHVYYNIRRNTPRNADMDWNVIVWDAAGLGVAVGSSVTKFSPGDEVWYAGSIVRPGANAEFHLVDERIVGRKPAKLNWADAAALPLTSLTAWEAFFDRMDVKRSVPGAANAILIDGGAGGVGSIGIQIAGRITDLTLSQTASRPENQGVKRQSVV